MPALIALRPTGRARCAQLRVALPRIAALLLATVSIAGRANTQLRVGLDAGAVASQFDASAVPAVTTIANPGAGEMRWLNQRSLGTLLRYDLPYAQFDADALIRGGDFGSHATGSMRALIAPPTWRGLRFSASYEAKRAPDFVADLPADSTALALHVAPQKIQLWGSEFTTRVAYASGKNGFWFSASNRRGAATSDSIGSRYLSAGYSRQLGDLIVGISIGSQIAQVAGTHATIRDTSITSPRTGSDSVQGDSITLGTVGDSGTLGGVRRLSEIAARLGWGRGRFAFDAVVNARPAVAGLSSAMWGEASGVAAITTRVAIVAGLHTTPSLPGQSYNPRRTVSVGMRIAPSALLRASSPAPVAPVAEAFALEAVAPGEYTVTMRLPNARMVELAGDFTGWKPVKLRQVDATRWEVTLPVASGTHHCNVRVDGAAWVPPPGVTAVDDEFNGRVGIFVVD